MCTTTTPTSTRSDSDVTERLYWPSWFLATLLTGIVAGFMLGHALILARFLDWLVLSATPALSQAYPAFRRSTGRSGLDAYDVLAGLQVAGTSAFLLVSLVARRHRGAALVAGVGGARPTPAPLSRGVRAP